MHGLLVERAINMCMCVAHSPSEVARSLPPECVEKGLNGAGECVVSEIDLVISYAKRVSNVLVMTGEREERGVVWGGSGFG